MTCVVESVVSNVTAIFKGDVLPAPSVALFDEDDAAVSEDVTSVNMTFHDPTPATTDYTPMADFTVTGVQVGNTNVWEFPLTTTETDDRLIRWVTRVTITDTQGTYTRQTADVRIVDYAEMWGNVTELANAAPGFTNSEYVTALALAEEAVRAWVSRSISSPVSGRVTRAVTLLASRALTDSPDGVNIASETMGDYTVRFRSPQGGAYQITDDIADLLRPWNPRSGSVYFGPDQSTDTDIITDYVGQVV